MSPLGNPPPLICKISPSHSVYLLMFDIISCLNELSTYVMILGILVTSSRLMPVKLGCVSRPLLYTLKQLCPLFPPECSADSEFAVTRKYVSTKRIVADKCIP